MSSMRYVGLACGVCLLLGASPIPAPAFAQSAREAKLTSALLGLHGELVEALAEITPELLRLQEDLVNALRVQLNGAREDERVAVRTHDEVSAVERAYFSEQECLDVMTARFKNKAISDKEILRIRIAVRSKAVASLKDHVEYLTTRYAAGEVTRSDIEAARIRALKEEISLEAMKYAAGERSATRTKPSRPGAPAPERGK
jgi:outer membrane protein TolC